MVAPLGKIDYWFVSEGRQRVHRPMLTICCGVVTENSPMGLRGSEVMGVVAAVLFLRRLTYSDERRLTRMALGVIADLAADPQRLAQSEAESSRTNPTPMREPQPPATSAETSRLLRRPRVGAGGVPAAPRPVMAEPRRRAHGGLVSARSSRWRC